MKFKKRYYYIKYDVKNKMLDAKQTKKIELIQKNKIYSNLFKQADFNYLIFKEDELVGFFSLRIKNEFIQISSFYVCKEYRNQGIATETINEIIWVIKHNSHYKMKYVLVNSYVESALFFLKRGFDFCKINKKLDYKKKNIILLFKSI